MRLRTFFSIAWMICAGVASLQTDARADKVSAGGNAAKGKAVFLKYCAGCHGPEGKGDGYRLLGRKPANLTEPPTTLKSETELLASIHEGRPNMPPWNARLTDDDSRDVLAYIRTFSGGRDRQSD